jgi:hypothetical protein
MRTALFPLFSLVLSLVLWAAVPSDALAGSGHDVPLDVKAWRLIERESGPVNYYTVVEDPQMPFLRARYVPPYKTAVFGIQARDADRPHAKGLRWQWRAMTLPNGGDECKDGREDSAADVYATWKRGLRWYTLKYVWSAVGTRGAVCDSKRNPFVAQDTIILETGGPTGAWKTEQIDLRAEFRKHFADGKADADVPDFYGVAVMTDGDQTRSESAADYGGFVLTTD